MSSVKLYYMITNGGDGSASANFYADQKTCQFACDMEEEAGEAFCETWPQEAEFDFDAKGKLLNPDGTKETLARALAEARGEDVEDEDDNEFSSRRQFKKSASPAADPEAVFTGKLHYIVRNCGDGSAAVDFYADAECASLAEEVQMEGGEAFCESTFSKTLQFNGNGVLLNPDSTMEGLKKEQAERRGEDLEEEDETPEAPAAEKAAEASPGKTPADVVGKTIVFTGKLSTQTRRQAEEAAIRLGAHVADSVTRNTDLVVAGEDAGSKLAKAKTLGVPVLSESEWNILAVQVPAAKKPTGPKFG